MHHDRHRHQHHHPPTNGRDAAVLADRLIALESTAPDGVVVLLGSATPGTGGYGQWSADPIGDLEVRLFGWPRLTPGHTQHVAAATSALQHDGFEFDGRDWVWRRTYRSVLVPVAAYAAQRALADGWSVVVDDLTSMVRPVVLDLGDRALVEAGLVCGRCTGDWCTGVPHGSGSDGC